MTPTCVDTACSEPAPRGPGTALAIAVRFPRHSNAQARYVQVYGHIWEAIEAFFSCVVSSSGASALRDIYIPAAALGKKNQTVSLFRELAIIYHGPRLRIHRVAWLPVCFGATSCCPLGSAVRHANAVGARLMQLKVERGGLTSEQHAELRTMVAGNLGVNLGRSPSDAFVFVSSQSAENGRYVVGERALVEQLERHVTRAYPRLHFVVVRPSQLSYQAELRLLLRTKVLVSLFGSALHNCRFLPSDAVVIELHGALKNDFANSGYHGLCAATMGLRWAGLPVRRAVPRDLMEVRFAAWNRDYNHAAVNATQLLQLVDLALADTAAAWREAHARYADPAARVFADPTARNWKVNAQRRERFLKLVERLPQYSAVAVEMKST